MIISILLQTIQTIWQLIIDLYKVKIHKSALQLQQNSRELRSILKL